MNSKLLKALHEWLEGGNRSVKVIMDHRWGWFGDEYIEEYYVYSFDVHYGKYITCIEDLPTDEELIKLKENNERITAMTTNAYQKLPKNYEKPVCLLPPPPPKKNIQNIIQKLLDKLSK